MLNVQYVFSEKNLSVRKMIPCLSGGFFRTDIVKAGPCWELTVTLRSQSHTHPITRPLSCSS